MYVVAALASTTPTHHTTTRCPHHTADLINVFEVFLPQLLLYPNPTDPLNGEAAALLMREPHNYNQKVKGEGRWRCGQLYQAGPLGNHTVKSACIGAACTSAQESSFVFANPPFPSPSAHAPFG